MALPKICTTKLLNQNFGTCISPDDYILPFFNTCGTNYFRPWRLCAETSDKEFGSSIENTNEKFNVTLDVQHFKPNEINVKVSDKELVIEGKHEERQDEHGFISRQFIRRYSLPNNCITETITSMLSSDGVLMIRAFKKADKDITKTEKIVPIKMTGSCQRQEELQSCSNGNKITAREAEVKQSDTDTENNNSSVEAETKKSVAETETKKMNTDSKKKRTVDTGITKITTETETKVSAATDTITDINLDKKDTQTIFKEDHCRLLKPELLKEAVTTTEKLITESKKETDELLKLISGDKAPGGNCTSEKLEDVIDQCKSVIAELKEKMSDTTMSSAKEMSNMKSSLMSEFTESMESSSYQSSVSSTTSSMKASSETAKELLICSELKSAAENIQ